MHGLPADLAGIAVDAGTASGAPLLSQPPAQVAGQQKTISLEGCAERNVEADVRVWHATLKVRVSTLPGAYAHFGRHDTSTIAKRVKLVVPVEFVLAR